MNQIEIGQGKSARRAYELSDISIVPSRRTRDADDVDASWQVDAFGFAQPLVTVGTKLAPTGGLAVLDLEAAGVPIDAGAIKDRLAEVRDAGGTCAVAVRPARAEAMLGVLAKAELDLLVILGRVVSAEHVSAQRDPLNLKSFVRHLEVPVLVGGCASYRAALHLMRTGAAGVIVGVDPASRGVGVPLATAIADARGARMRHLDETGVYVHLIAAGGAATGGEVAKAVVCGADAVLVDESVDAATVVSDLRRSMATCGYGTLKEFQNADLVVHP